MAVVVGARPNFMKVAPLLSALGRYNGHFAPCLVHTGQHYDLEMSAQFFRELELPAPDLQLEVGSGPHGAQTAAVMERFEQVCLARRPDWVVVVGDVNSTLACALVGAKLGVRVAHVEAGLRSFDPSMPEEINRRVTDVVSDALFTPSADADANLQREGVAAARIFRVGNIMIDSLLRHLDRARARRTYEPWGLRPGGFAYVTLHRPANVDRREALAAILARLRELAARLPVVFAVHPRTRKMLRAFGLDGDGTEGALRLSEPLGYHDSLCLAESARFVLTDSGGLQEETTFFRTPCLTLRPNTERPVTVTHGSNRLTSLVSLEADVEALLAQPARRGEVPPLWDGRTAERIVETFLQL